ncbi:MAG: hypothetical protein F6K29_34040 [Okeania sp. SIO2G5]|nr:hypothetical protein [Okeania sp. SIO2G5]
MDLTDQNTVEFIDIPAYSPQYNLAEYIIHQIRLNILHHMPVDATIKSISKEIEMALTDKQLQTSEQIENTIRHICNLVHQS